jgi:hypothetical protein
LLIRHLSSPLHAVTEAPTVLLLLAHGLIPPPLMLGLLLRPLFLSSPADLSLPMLSGVLMVVFREAVKMRSIRIGMC